ncbi:hypothetical protein [Streptomyces sp. NPDC091879]|jgi:hypothetical protein|uniref:hypothetical protein n=1 Tax=Streptomyces sp. NPDC091879 TaxID=3366006 RepID=UPI0038020ABD
MEDWHIQNGIQGYAHDSELDALQQRELRSEQMEFYKRANTPPFEGFGGWQGVKEAATGVGILMIFGMILKYGFGIG